MRSNTDKNVGYPFLIWQGSVSRNAFMTLFTTPSMVNQT